MRHLLTLILFMTGPLTCLLEGKRNEDLVYTAVMAFGEGVKAEAAGDFKKAIASYRKAAAQVHSANLHGNLANLYFKVGDYGKAILHYRKALLLSPNNRELKANLARVREIAKIQIPARSAATDYFAPSTISIWCWSTTSLFWIGLFVGLILMKRLVSSLIKFLVAVTWLSLVAFGSYATWRADQNVMMLFREAVAVSLPGASGDEASKVALRRYAGDSNEANAQLISGEIVHIDLDQESKLKQHRTADNSIWYLARSGTGGKKGWATSKELLRVLD